MGDFTCVCDISDDLTNAFKVKMGYMNRNMTCFSPNFSNIDFELICAWGAKPLQVNEDLIKRLVLEKENSSTIQPNCGKHDWLIRIAEGEDGWTALCQITKKASPNSSPLE